MRAPSGACPGRTEPVRAGLEPDAPPDAPDFPASTGAPKTQRSARYVLALAAAYALAPMLALAAWRSLSATLSSGAAAALGSLLLTLPSLVHLAHGATRRAGVVLVSLFGYLALGGAGGAALGRALARANCVAEAPGECGLTVLAWLVVGAGAGTLLAYSAHAVRQVLRTLGAHDGEEAHVQ